MSATEENQPRFEIDQNSIDPAVFGLESYASPTAPAPRIDRRSAMQVPAVMRVRNVIAGTLGTLPLEEFDGLHRRINNTLFQQPEKHVPRSVTMARTFEDMLFEGIAWWEIVEFDWTTYPKHVRRLNPRTVDVNEDTGKVYVNGKHVPDDRLIRFDSPNDALLVAGARAIRTALHLDAASGRYAEGAPPVDYFTPAADADPADDAEVIEMLNAWKTARQSRSTGYVPAALEYHVGGWSPEQLQLADARQHAVLEIARAAGVDPEVVGVSTTSRTYRNMWDQRKDFLDFTLGSYRQAVEDRLSMGDVTPRNHYVRFNLSEFLRSDDKTRMEIAAAGVTNKVLTEAEAKSLFDPRRPVDIADETEVRNVNAASQTPDQKFGDDPDAIALRLDAPGAQAFEVDTEKRVIKGLLVPYGKAARSNGQWWQFDKGTLQYSDVSRVKLWIQHDSNRAVGVATELDDRDDGLYGTFRIARGPAGDEALTYAEDGVLDGFSIGLGQGGKFQRRGEINYAISAPLMETSLTPAPSFDDARVHTVAASQAQTEGTTMPDEITTPETPDFSAVTDAIRAGFEALATPQAGRETVSASGAVVTNEPLPYRFDGIAGAHSFSADLRSSASGDSEARQRLDEFMDEAFAVTTDNVSTLNPTQNRPELYVPNLEYSRPLFGMVSTGTITDKTPFTIPKFASAAGLVGPHTEGVEPTPGSFTATNQTVTPSPVSGKIEINREVWDQGGSPQADAIIWREMVAGYYEALEAKVASTLNALTLTEINLAGVTDEALVDAVQNIFVDLQFVRGGNRYSALALDGLLFKALVNASDTAGRKLLPVVGPSNAQGSVAGNFGAVQVGTQRGVAAWALGAANDSHSYLFVPSSVWLWASAPKRFTFEYQVKSIDMAVWGYSASAVLRDTDVKRIDYTTADA